MVLGNLDKHNWTKHDCFAPVMSQLEFRLLISLIVQFKLEPRQGDFTQAFCQSTLPTPEAYVCSPLPHNCSITRKNIHLLLQKRFYELKRSSKNWHKKSKWAFKSI